MTWFRKKQDPLDPSADVDRRFGQQGVGELTAIMLAAGSGRDEKVRDLHRRGANVNAVDSDGDPVLFYAASRGRVSTVNLLLSLGANPDPRPNVNGETPLTLAAGLATPIRPRPPGTTAEEYTKIVLALLRAGADPSPMYSRRLVLYYWSNGGIVWVRPEHVSMMAFRDDLAVMYLTRDQ